MMVEGSAGKPPDSGVVVGLGGTVLASAADGSLPSALKLGSDSGWTSLVGTPDSTNGSEAARGGSQGVGPLTENGSRAWTSSVGVWKRSSGFLASNLRRMAATPAGT